MTPLATNFDNLHQVLRNLYQEMLPLCGDMVGICTTKRYATNPGRATQNETYNLI